MRSDVYLYDAVGRLGDFGHNDADRSRDGPDYGSLYHGYFFLDSPKREAVSVGEKPPAIYNLITSPESICFRVEAANASGRIVSSNIVYVDLNALTAAIENAQAKSGSRR